RRPSRVSSRPCAISQCWSTPSPRWRRSAASSSTSTWVSRSCPTVSMPSCMATSASSGRGIITAYGRRRRHGSEPPPAMPSTTAQSTWDARIARARELASIRPAARDLLLFYAALAEYQRGLAAGARDAGTFDIDIVIKAIPGFLDWLRSAGRADLADSVDVDCVTSALRQKSNDSHSLPAEAGSHPAEAGSHPAEAGSHPAEAALFVIESL